MKNRIPITQRPERCLLNRHHRWFSAVAALWPMCFPGSTYLHDLSGNNVGTLVGYTGAGNTPADQWTFDKYLRRGALGFNGSADYVTKAAPVVIAAPFTMSCWFNSSSITASQVLMAVNDNTISNWTAWYLSNAGATGGDPIQAISANNNTFTVAASATGYTANTWYHAGAVFLSATSRTAYINGVAGTPNTTSNTPAAVKATSLGWAQRTSGSDAYFVGSMTDAVIFNGAFSSDDMKILANPGDLMFDKLLLSPRRRAFAAAVAAAASSRRRRLLCGV
jgi:hypothetical protein